MIEGLHHTFKFTLTITSRIRRLMQRDIMQSVKQVRRTLQYSRFDDCIKDEEDMAPSEQFCCLLVSMESR